MTPGTYTATAEGQTSGVFASIEITVIGDDEEPAPPPVGELPTTGSSSTTPALQMAGIALLAGLGLVAVAYRRRTRSV